MKNRLRSTELTSHITRKELLDNFDEYLDRVDNEDMGIDITNDGKDELVLYPARWFDTILTDDYAKKVKVIMSKKKIKAPFYTVKESSIRSLYNDTRLPNGYLYAHGRNRTKITAADLPEYYIPITVYRNEGYISVNGIVNIVYRPNYHINHMHKDDHLYISYTTPIKKEPRVYNVSDDFDYYNYDALLWGSSIIDFIEAVRKFKTYDIEPIAKEVIKKEKYFMENYPECCLEHMYLLSEKTED